jgi:hypothetical protein
MAKIPEETFDAWLKQSAAHAVARQKGEQGTKLDPVVLRLEGELSNISAWLSGSPNPLLAAAGYLIGAALPKDGDDDETPF